MILTKLRKTFKSDGVPLNYFLPHGERVDVGSFLFLILAHSVKSSLQGQTKLHNARVVGQDLKEKYMNKYWRCAKPHRHGFKPLLLTLVNI